MSEAIAAKGARTKQAARSGNAGQEGLEVM